MKREQERERGRGFCKIDSHLVVYVSLGIPQEEIKTIDLHPIDMNERTKRASASSSARLSLPPRDANRRRGSRRNSLLCTVTPSPVNLQSATRENRAASSDAKLFSVPRMVLFALRITRAFARARAAASIPRGTVANTLWGGVPLAFPRASSYPPPLLSLSLSHDRRCIRGMSYPEDRLRTRLAAGVS